MLRTVVALTLVVPLLAGCLSGDDDDGKVMPPDLGYDPTKIRVDDVVIHEATIPSWDGVDLDAVVYEPTTADALPNGSAVPWPVVVFLHPWQGPKEYWTDFGDPGAQEQVDLLDQYARAGMIAVAYDARGWYQSGGQSTFAGAAELADISAVISHIEGNYTTNGRVGIVGEGYGGGQALTALAREPRIDAVVAVHGWTDLFEGLMPGRVPKLQWTEAMYALTVAGSQGRASAEVHSWWRDAHMRTGMDGIEAQMDVRSILGSTIHKPVMVCQGLQDSLFPQSHHVLQQAQGPVHAVYYTGGHTLLPTQCFDPGVGFLRFWLGGIDNGAGDWPAVTTADAASDTTFEYEGIPGTAWDVRYLVNDDLAQAPQEARTFTIDQRVLANPLTEPSMLWDLTGQGYNPIPEQFKQDPTASVFTTPALGATDVLVGAPQLLLRATPETRDGPWQVVASLHVIRDGSSILLGRTAYAAQSEEHHDNGTVVLEFPWTKIDLHASDRLSVKLASSDQSTFLPYPADFSVTFDGSSRLALPLFEPAE